MVVIACRRVMVPVSWTGMIVRGQPVVMVRMIVADYSWTCNDDTMDVDTARA